MNSIQAHGRHRRIASACLLLLALQGAPLPAIAEEPRPVLAAIGVEEAHLSPAFWVARLSEPDRVLADRAAIEAQNAELLRADPSMYDLRAVPPRLTREQVAGWIRGLADRPTSTLYDAGGESIPAERLGSIADNRNLAGVGKRTAARYGLVVSRAALRTFPTTLRVFRSSGATDIDRFQESALFPGTPVVIVHESLDERWWFVLSPRYAAWIEKRHVAEGPPEEVFAYLDKEPYRIVTGATAATVFTPEQPQLSQLQIDMGVRLPVLADWPANEPVNGQHPYTAHVIELPLRSDDGRLQLAPALLQKNADTAGDYLPLTRANIVRQGFKFLGERYGWGHSYGARDCSGFVSEVYRSMGATMPRNTSAQSVSPALEKRLFGTEDSGAERIAAARSLDTGDLVYIPGHVMMVIGKLDGEPWVIHDTTGFGHLTPDGRMRRVHLNGVSVTPLMPLQASEEDRYIDRMTSIVRIAPVTDITDASPL